MEHEISIRFEGGSQAEARELLAEALKQLEDDGVVADWGIAAVFPWDERPSRALMFVSSFNGDVTQALMKLNLIQGIERLHVVPTRWPTKKVASLGDAQLGDAQLDDVMRYVTSACDEEPVKTTGVLVDWLYDLLMGGRIDLMQRTLQALDAEVLPLRALTGTLLVTRSAAEDLGSARRDLLAQLETALRVREGLSPERVAETIERVR
tara:strand:+ start:267439 stop:268062 length:624 start_codon:yes stop_codon:yes gene_type:complete